MGLLLKQVKINKILLGNEKILNPALF